MSNIPIPSNEKQRLQALRSYDILDSAPEIRFNRIVELVAKLLDVPIVLVSLVDDERQWFKASFGLQASETPRDLAFCAHTIMNDTPMVVENALLDERFAENPFVTGDPGIRFYAGAPLITMDGFRLGTLCTIDNKPRELDSAQVELIKEFSAVVVDEMELFKSTALLEQQARELHERNQDLSAFVHTLSHDLQGPIRRIRSFCDLLDGAESNEMRQNCHTFIKSSSEKADILIADLRAYFGIDSEMVWEVCSAEDCLQEACSHLSDMVNSSGAVIEQDTLPDFKTNSSILTLLFKNLVENAIKYRTDADPVISVSAKEAGDFWEFSVRDNGLGIPEKMQGQIFELLRRLHSDSEIPGSGMGLAIARKIVNKCGGEIWVESAPGDGSTFYFTLPAEHQAEPVLSPA